MKATEYFVAALMNAKKIGNDDKTPPDMIEDNFGAKMLEVINKDNYNAQVFNLKWTEECTAQEWNQLMCDVCNLLDMDCNPKLSYLDSDTLQSRVDLWKGKIVSS